MAGKASRCGGRRCSFLVSRRAGPAHGEVFVRIHLLVRRVGIHVQVEGRQN